MINKTNKNKIHTVHVALSSKISLYILHIVRFVLSSKFCLHILHTVRFNEQYHQKIVAILTKNKD